MSVISMRTSVSKILMVIRVMRMMLSLWMEVRRRVDLARRERIRISLKHHTIYLTKDLSLVTYSHQLLKMGKNIKSQMEIVSWTQLVEIQVLRTTEYTLPQPKMINLGALSRRTNPWQTTVFLDMKDPTSLKVSGIRTGSIRTQHLGSCLNPPIWSHTKQDLRVASQRDDNRWEEGRRARGEESTTWVKGRPPTTNGRVGTEQVPRSSSSNSVPLPWTTTQLVDKDGVTTTLPQVDHLTWTNNLGQMIFMIMRSNLNREVP